MTRTRVYWLVFSQTLIGFLGGLKVAELFGKSSFDTFDIAFVVAYCGMIIGSSMEWVQLIRQNFKPDG